MHVYICDLSISLQTSPILIPTECVFVPQINAYA